MNEDAEKLKAEVAKAAVQYRDATRYESLMDHMANMRTATDEQKAEAYFARVAMEDAYRRLETARELWDAARGVQR